jgi:hypothetical protein
MPSFLWCRHFYHQRKTIFSMQSHFEMLWHHSKNALSMGLIVKKKDNTFIYFDRKYVNREMIKRANNILCVKRNWFDFIRLKCLLWHTNVVQNALRKNKRNSRKYKGNQMCLLLHLRYQNIFFQTLELGCILKVLTFDTTV